MVSLLLLIIIYLAFINLGLPDSLLGSAWPSMHIPLGVPLHYAGYLSMIIASGTVVSSVLSPRVIKRFGAGIVAAVSVAMTASALLGFSFSHTFTALCICAVPLRLGGGAVGAALNNYVALHYKARHMSWLHGFWGVGASIGPMIMAFFLTHKNSWNSGYRVVGVIQVCFALLLFASLPLWGKNKTADMDDLEEGEPRNPARDRALFRAGNPAGIFAITGVKQSFLSCFCYCAIEVTAGLWGSSYLVTAKNIPPHTAAQWISLYYIGITAGRFISGFLTIKLNNRRMIRLGQGLIACGIVMLTLPFEAMLLPGLFTIGLGCAPIYPALLHETPASFGAENSQTIIGLQMASAYIGSMLIPPLFGKIASYAGFGILPLFIGVVLILMFFMVEMMKMKIDNSRIS